MTAEASWGLGKECKDAWENLSLCKSKEQSTEHSSLCAKRRSFQAEGCTWFTIMRERLIFIVKLPPTHSLSWKIQEKFCHQLCGFTPFAGGLIGADSGTKTEVMFNIVV